MLIEKFQSYLRAFPNGNLSYSIVSTQEERLATMNCAHVASATSSETFDANYMDAYLVNLASHGCECDPMVTGKLGVTSEDKL